MALPKSANSKGSLAKGTIGLLLVCVAAAAMLLAARRPVQSVDKTMLPPAKGVVMATQQKAAVAKATVVTNQTNQKRAKGSPTTTANATVVAAQAATPEMATDKESNIVTGVMPEATTATIAGCLEHDGDSFLLKDSEGADAPKARSWKSGFLKKGAARINIVDASNRLNLTSHVGERVSISGMLADRDMQARSLRRVAKTCE
jgi:hypothetical protein